MRATEYEQAGVSARWLDAPHARNAYDYVLKYSHPRRYGLNEQSVANIHRLIVESQFVADAWLRTNFPSSGTVQIVYGEADVAVVESETFLQRWWAVFVPGRDDAVILHNLSPAIMFYCHEQELEIGQRKE